MFKKIAVLPLLLTTALATSPSEVKPGITVPQPDKVTDKEGGAKVNHPLTAPAGVGTKAGDTSVVPPQPQSQPPKEAPGVVAPLSVEPRKPEAVTLAPTSAPVTPPAPSSPSTPSTPSTTPAPISVSPTAMAVTPHKPEASPTITPPPSSAPVPLSASPTVMTTESGKLEGNKGAPTPPPTSAPAPISASPVVMAMDSKDPEGTKGAKEKEGGTAPTSSLSSPTPSSATPVSLPESPKDGREKEVLDIIQKYPEVLIKAIQTYGEQQQKEVMKKEAEKIAHFKDELTGDKAAIVGGNPNGTIKLIVFADPNCPHCRHFEANLGEIKGLFSNLKIYSRPWPIMGKESTEVVTGLMAAAKQGYDKYDALALRIASSNEKMDKTKFLKLAKELGLNVKKLKDDMGNAILAAETKSNHDLAVKMGLDAAPTIIMFDAAGEIQLLMPQDKEALKKTLTEARA
jgi:protein-disulfide isomerase